MKRLTGLLLILLSLALLGCSGGKNGAEPTQPADTVLETTAPEAQTAEATAEATAAVPEVELYAPADHCVDYRSFIGFDGNSTPMVETEDCIYILQNGFLYFSDKEYKDFMPLCAKPNCGHDTQDCDAFLGSTVIQYRGGYLYYVEGSGFDEDDGEYRLHSPRLCRMRPDGSAHEVMADIPAPEADFTPLYDYWTCLASNKYFIFKVRLIKNDSEASPVAETHMFSFDIDTYASAELFINEKDREKAAGVFLLLEGRDDKIYGQMKYSFYGGANKIVEVDLTTGKTRDLCKFKPELRNMERISGIRGDALYFIDFDFGTDEETLYRLDINTGELTAEHVDSARNSNWMIFDSYSGYYYRQGATFREPEERGIYICDASFGVVEFLPESEMPAEYAKYYTDFIAAGLEQYPDLRGTDFYYGIMIGYVTRDHIFGIGPQVELVSQMEEVAPDRYEEIHYISVTYDPMSIPTWYIDKAEIGTGNAQWRPWAP